MLFLAAAQGCEGGGYDQAEPAQQTPRISSFSAVATEHFVGEAAELVAVFSGGTARIDPGAIPVESGRPVLTPRLATSEPFRLTVGNGASSGSTG